MSLTPYKNMIALLDVAVRHTMKNYHQFLQQNDFENAKEFGAYQSACKAALSHLESLLKLQQLCRTQAAQEATQKGSSETAHKNDPSSALALERILLETRHILSHHND